MMLHMAGVSMDQAKPSEWQHMAHRAAAMLQGSKITLEPLNKVVQRNAESADKEKGASKTKSSAALTSKTATKSQHSAAAAPSSAEAPVEVAPKVVGNERLKLRRWVQTQQSLFAEGRLSQAQLRYLVFLGLTWILSDLVMFMDEVDWLACYKDLGLALAAGKAPGREVSEWLAHQKGLHVIGRLSHHRVALLKQVGIDFAFHRSPEQDTWETKLSLLLAFKGEHASLDDRVIKDFDPELWTWVVEQKRLLAARKLPRNRVSQLQAIGLALDVDEAGVTQKRSTAKKQVGVAA